MNLYIINYYNIIIIFKNYLKFSFLLLIIIVLNDGPLD